MTEIKLQISGVESDHSIHCATITAITLDHLRDGFLFVDSTEIEFTCDILSIGQIVTARKKFTTASQAMVHCLERRKAWEIKMQDKTLLMFSCF